MGRLLLNSLIATLSTHKLEICYIVDDGLVGKIVRYQKSIEKCEKISQKPHLYLTRDNRRSNQRTKYFRRVRYLALS